MKKRYGETIDYKKNRANKIARNKSRRNKYKMRFVSGKNIQQLNRGIDSVRPPREIRVLSQGVSFSKAKYSYEAPKVLSFKSNPDETTSFITMIASSFLDKSHDIDLRINFNKTDEIDIGPLSIIDVLIDKGMKYIEKSGRRVHVHGLNPVNQEANLIFSYSGLPKTLGIFEGDEQGIITLDPLTNSPDANTETHKIIRYYDDCLKKVGYTINEKGQIFFFKLINEIVDNAIIHCGSKNPTYITSGFYNHHLSKGQLSVISIGNSIYDTLDSPQTMSEIIDKINKIVNIHQQLKYNGYNPETIWTICSLQSGVSCKRNDENMDRGTGTVKFIEAFITLGQSQTKEKPTMTLLSGKSHILFDGKYKMEEKVAGNKTIAFNVNNNLLEKPDSNYVKTTTNKFPGVAINIEFYIDREYLSKFRRK